jgi:hypothetical protein
LRRASGAGAAVARKDRPSACSSSARISPDRGSSRIADAAWAPVSLHRLFELPLHDVLEHEVDRQQDVMALLRRRAQLLEEHRPLRVADGEVLGGVALQ